MSPEPESRDLLVVPFDEDTQLDAFPYDSIPPCYSDITNFLDSTLSQRKADLIYEYLRYAGEKGDYRTLHEQYTYGRKIVISEAPCLHLVTKDDSTIFIQPLHPCLTNYAFFKTHIATNHELYRFACGFLYSYTNIVKFQSDFRIAQSMNLIPSEWTWNHFSRFISSLLSRQSLRQNIHRRYVYGELRLGPLNTHFVGHQKDGGVYHPCGNHLTESGLIRHGYVLLFIFAFNSLVLSAMQVGLASPPSSCPIAVQAMGFWYSIIVLIFLACASVFMLFHAWFVTASKSFGGFAGFAKRNEPGQHRGNSHV